MDDVLQRLMAFIEADDVLWEAVYEIRRLRADNAQLRQHIKMLEDVAKVSNPFQFGVFND